MSVKELLDKKLESVGGVVKDSILSKLFDREVKKRTDACLVVLEKIESTEEKLKKLKVEDLVAYNEFGEPTQKAYSKARFDDIKRTTGELDKLNNALEMALENNDFSKVFKFAEN